jgi:hypothetical protein
MLLTPGATPLTDKNSNRFGVLASPSATRNMTRVPLKAKSQNIVESGIGADANWRVNRKRDPPKTPVRANKNGQCCLVWPGRFSQAHVVTFRSAPDALSFHATSQQSLSKPKLEPICGCKWC